MIEAAVVTFALAVITAVTLTGTLMVFTRAGLEYASEQTLYCLAEGKPTSACERTLHQSVASLPFTRARSIHVRRLRGHWRVNITWAVAGQSFRLVKALNDRRITAPAASR